MNFVCYPKCTTCQKAKKWLETNGVEYGDRHIKEENPTKDELVEWHKKSGFPLKKFFNTSGLLYKDMKLKDKLPASALEEFAAAGIEMPEVIAAPVLAKDDITEVLLGLGYHESEIRKIYPELKKLQKKHALSLLTPPQNSCHSFI